MRQWCKSRSRSLRFSLLLLPRDIFFLLQSEQLCEKNYHDDEHFLYNDDESESPKQRRRRQ